MGEGIGHDLGLLSQRANYTLLPHSVRFPLERKQTTELIDILLRDPAPTLYVDERFLINVLSFR